MKLKLSCCFLLFTFFMLSGCNMPTPPSRITGTYNSGIRYEQYECDRLSIELLSLRNRENQLVDAQNKRIKNSKVQAFWWGFGSGDGVEAAELANVRGEINAIEDVMRVKACW